MSGHREPGPDRRRAALKSILEIPIILLIAFALVFGFVRPVVAAPYRIPTESMVPTLMVQDRLLVNKLAYDINAPNRGDIAVFENQQGLKDPLIKRVIALPGETVELREGDLYVNGDRLDEPYLRRRTCDRAMPITCTFGPTKIPKDHYFMMGDNRTRSVDSRYFGPVPEQDIIGEALVRFWPPDRAGGPG